MIEVETMAVIDPEKFMIPDNSLRHIIQGVGYAGFVLAYNGFHELDNSSIGYLANVLSIYKKLDEP